MSRLSRFAFRFALFAVLLLLLPTWAHAQSRSYTTIKEVTITPLSNGVQVKITADGILQTQNADTNGLQHGCFFPDARNGTGKNFFEVNSYPVSYIQLSTPQGAANGIGVQMTIRNLVATNSTLTATPDGQGALFTIQSGRTIQTKTGAAASTAATSGDKPDTSTKVDFENGQLSVRAVKADIHELLGAIAKKTGLNISVDDSVTRNVSLNLQDVTPQAAISAIATSSGLALREQNGTFAITKGVPTDLATYLLSETQSFRIQNTQAGTASGLLPNFLYEYVKTNPEQNAVVVSAPSQMLAKIGADLRRVDTPSPQIVVEAIAVELTDSTVSDLGIRLGNPASGEFGSVDVGGGLISYSTVGKLPRNFQASLTALEQKGRARVRARPRLAVLNGRTANIFIGAQRFILTQFNQYGQTQTRIQPVDVGVKLSVTPLTGDNREITTRITPEVSNITELDLQTGLPVLSTRRADTTVRVRDGETIAIGGLTLAQEQTTRGKIPFLGDIPLIGGLFRSRSRDTVQTELVVFITPRILPADATLTSAAPQAATPPATLPIVPDAASPPIVLPPIPAPNTPR